MQTLINLAIPGAIVVVTVVLGFGIYSLMRGGEYARSNSNKLMRLRVIAQAVAVAVLMGSLWWVTHHRGG